MEQYPRLQSAQKMLGAIDRAIKEAEREGEPGIRLFIVKGGPEVGVYLFYTSQKIDLAKELDLNAGETLGLFMWAEDEGYVRPNYGRVGRLSEAPMGVLYHLESKGYELIGELPDPAERLLHSLDALSGAIDERQDLDPQQKQLAKRAVEELKTFVRGVPPGIAVEVGSAFIRSVWGGW